MSSLPCPPDIRDKRSAPVRVLALLPPPPLEADEAEDMREESEEAALAAWNASWVHAPSEPPGGLCGLSVLPLVLTPGDRCRDRASWTHPRSRQARASASLAMRNLQSKACCRREPSWGRWRYDVQTFAYRDQSARFLGDVLSSAELCDFKQRCAEYWNAEQLKDEDKRQRCYPSRQTRRTRGAGYSCEARAIAAGTNSRKVPLKLLRKLLREVRPRSAGSCPVLPTRMTCT